MRMSAKAEYAVRAMTQLASVESGMLVTTEDLAKSQGIPAQFLVDILSDLRTDRLVRSHRGRDGGYELARPAQEISVADVLRCIDGPLASVRDIGLGDLRCGRACVRCSRKPAWPTWPAVCCLPTSASWPATTDGRKAVAGTRPESALSRPSGWALVRRMCPQPA